jgi:tetratricopeptide (TPR) repeat protein
LRVDCAVAPVPSTTPQSPNRFEQWLDAAATLMHLHATTMRGERSEKRWQVALRSAMAHLIAGSLLELKGDVSRAEIEYRRSAAIAPDAGNQLALAGIYRRQRRTDDELTALRRAVDHMLGLPSIEMLQLLSDAELRAGHPQKALEAIDQAISLYPGEPPPIMVRARKTARRALAQRQPRHCCSDAQRA